MIPGITIANGTISHRAAAKMMPSWPCRNSAASVLHDELVEPQ
jgi:hypothetical protein